MEGPEQLELAKDVTLFAAGLLGGYFTSLHFYKKQKVEDEKTEDRVFSSLEKNYEQALRNGIKESNIIHSLRSIEAELEPLSDIVEIKRQLDGIQSTLVELKGPEQKEPPIDLLLRYKALGDKWSELVSQQLNLHVLDAEGRLSIERLLSVHMSIFPDGYAWAGKYRKEHVYVVDQFGTTSRIVDLATAESKTATIPPEAIEKNLEKLFSYWNVNLLQIVSLGPQKKIDEIAHFHHEFELIHPFLDGNGRIGRMLLQDQLAFLFGRTVAFRPSREDYYRALRMLNMGEPSQLRGLIENELRRFHVEL